MSYSKFTFFWSGPFSQWYPVKIMVDGVRYNCAEQYMMAAKASLFNDDETLAAIMKAKTPKEQKALGRQVKNFNPDKWNAAARGIVFDGNMKKFCQNDDLRKLLLDTAGTELVEASPHDTVWGIGLAADHPDAQDKTKWRGKNWLGEVLTSVRDVLIETGNANR